jgi:hypothetical protein
MFRNHTVAKGGNERIVFWMIDLDALFRYIKDFAESVGVLVGTTRSLSRTFKRAKPHPHRSALLTYERLAQATIIARQPASATSISRWPNSTSTPLPVWHHGISTLGILLLAVTLAALFALRPSRPSQDRAMPAVPHFSNAGKLSTSPLEVAMDTPAPTLLLPYFEDGSEYVFSGHVTSFTITTCQPSVYVFAQSTNATDGWWNVGHVTVYLNGDLQTYAWRFEAPLTSPYASPGANISFIALMASDDVTLPNWISDVREINSLAQSDIVAMRFPGRASNNELKRSERRRELHAEIARARYVEPYDRRRALAV